MTMRCRLRDRFRSMFLSTELRNVDSTASGPIANSFPTLSFEIEELGSHHDHRSETRY
jgi:hypothetical protein